MKETEAKKTTVGEVQADVLEFTAGADRFLDVALVEADCLGTAAHVTMLSHLLIKPPLFSDKERAAVIHELIEIIRSARKGEFQITVEDQDVHLAVERLLTAKLGDLGKKVHTGRSRNDQIAVDLRLYAKEQLINLMEIATSFVEKLLIMAEEQMGQPMVGRTHFQPAMPSSVGLWASAHAESLLEDISLLKAAYDINNQCPLGAAAGYGVPLPLDREEVSGLLGFKNPITNVLYAITARGKMESIIVAAVCQVMLTLSRLAEDLIIYCAPEFNYFRLPNGFCTGSSIMPQKKNPDVLELIRSKAARVTAAHSAIVGMVKGLPTGYNRDVQEAKPLLMESLKTGQDSLRILEKLIPELGVNEEALYAGFTRDVFATDRAMELVAEGMPFRDAYNHVKTHLDELTNLDPQEMNAQKISLGAPGNLALQKLRHENHEARQWLMDEKNSFHGACAKLLGTTIHH